MRVSEVTRAKCNDCAAAFVLQVHVFSTIDRLMNPEHRGRKLELSTTQITGSALAAMSGAFFASWAGTTGTIVGAAVGSVIVTVGAATYTWSLQRTRDAVKRTAAQVRLSGRTPAERPERHLLSLPWGKVALTSVAVTAIGLGGITAIEAAAGRPVSSYTGSSASTGTTLGNAVGSSGGKATPRDSRTSTAEKSESTRQTPTKDADTRGTAGNGTGPTTPSTPATPTPAPSADPTPTPEPPVTDPVTPSPDPEPSTQP